MMQIFRLFVKIHFFDFFFSSASPSIFVQESEDEEHPDQQHEVQVRVDWSNEKPPPYDVAVVKPPPYDLQCHLTPQQLVRDLPVKPRRCSSEELLIVPSRLPIEDNDKDMFLPSYQDAVRLPPYNDTDEHSQRDEGS